jgi:hypothetical protein
MTHWLVLDMKMLRQGLYMLPFLMTPIFLYRKTKCDGF